MAISTPATSLVQLSHVSKSFGPVQVLKDVSLEMIPGEVLCLAGENGAGKSTLIKILSGLFVPTSGNIIVDGTPVHFRSPHDAAAAGIGTVYQDENMAYQYQVLTGNSLTCTVTGSVAKLCVNSAN